MRGAKVPIRDETHSILNACTGLVEAARRAGMILAIQVAAPQSTVPTRGFPLRLGNILPGNIVKIGMKTLLKPLQFAACVALFACNWTCFAQSDVSCSQTLDAPLRSSAVLAIDSQPAGIEIVGTDLETIHVTCKADDTDSAMNTRLQFSGTPTHAKLKITGANLKHNNLQIRIEVPRKVNLGIQMAAGQVKVDAIVGDKDINLHAGQITISSPHAWDYKNVDVSVSIGQVNAQVYGANKGGFFRSFQKENADGEYRLHAHVTTGQIDLLGKGEHTMSDPQ